MHTLHQHPLLQRRVAALSEEAAMSGELRSQLAEAQNRSATLSKVQGGTLLAVLVEGPNVAYCQSNIVAAWADCLCSATCSCVQHLQRTAGSLEATRQQIKELQQERERLRDRWAAQAGTCLPEWGGMPCWG
jgi:DNA repair exonuclease SbcCD ATPase subunit